MRRVLVMLCLALTTLLSFNAAAGPIGDQLVKLGLTAEYFAAAGVSPTAVTDSVTRLTNAETTRSQLDAAEQALQSANVALTSAADALKTNPADSVLLLQWRSARSLVAQRRTSLQSARQTAWDVALAGLSATQREKLVRLRNRAQGGGAPELSVAAVDETTWSKILVALKAEAIAQREGTELAEANAAILATIRSRLDVIEAALAISMNTASIRDILSAN